MGTNLVPVDVHHFLADLPLALTAGFIPSVGLQSSDLFEVTPRMDFEKGFPMVDVNEFSHQIHLDQLPASWMLA